MWLDTTRESSGRRDRLLAFRLLSLHCQSQQVSVSSLHTSARSWQRIPCKKQHIMDGRLSYLHFAKVFGFPNVVSPHLNITSCGTGGNEGKQICTSALFESTFLMLENSWNGSAALFTFPCDVSFDTTNQYLERWSVCACTQVHFSDVFSNLLDLLIGSIEARQSQWGGVVFIYPSTFVTYLCWKTGRPSCLLGTQDVMQAAEIPGHQKLTTFELSLLETTGFTETKQDVSGEVSWRVSRRLEGHATWRPQNHRQFLY